MAGRAIIQRFGRLGTQTDQAWIESLFGHVNSDWPHLEKIRNPSDLALELDRVRTDYNTLALPPASATFPQARPEHGRTPTTRSGHEPGCLATIQGTNWRRKPSPCRSSA